MTKETFLGFRQMLRVYQTMRRQASTNIYIKAAVIQLSIMAGALVLLATVGGWVWLAIVLGKQYGAWAYFTTVFAPALVGVYFGIVRVFKNNG
jgi:hypothetical protein